VSENTKKPGLRPWRRGILYEGSLASVMESEEYGEGEADLNSWARVFASGISSLMRVGNWLPTDSAC